MLSQKVIAEAKNLGFSGCHIVAADSTLEAKHSDWFRAWIAQGLHGDMAYMAAHKDRSDPHLMLSQVQSIVIVSLSYNTKASDKADSDQETSPTFGFLARYARGNDYHGVMKNRLTQLANRLLSERSSHDIKGQSKNNDKSKISPSRNKGKPIIWRAIVDSAPLLERAYAEASGLGFIGKNTLCITPGVGSYTLLGALLLDAPLQPTPPMDQNCGQCTLCLEKCPTDAFISPYHLDARRCISYLTIEFDGAIPLELRPKIGNRIFGCDICQEVCPYNGSVKAAVNSPCDDELLPLDKLKARPLVELLTIGSSAYRRMVKGTALRRTSRNQFVRNVAIALGNSGDVTAIPVLKQVAKEFANDNVLEHMEWAIGELTQS